MFFLFQEGSNSWLSWLFKFFIDPSALDDPAAEMIASNWVFVAIVVAVIFAGLMEIIKGVRKERASLNRKHWPIRKVLGWMLLGWVPILVAILTEYYLNISFKQILGVGGLFKGIVFAWVLYTISMFVADFIVPRFRSDYGK